MTIGANVAKSCTAPGAYTVSLGNYNGTSAVSGTSNVLFKCTFGTFYTVKLKPAGGAEASNGTLKSSPNTTPINYNLTYNGLLKSRYTGLGSGLNPGAGFIAVTPTVVVPANQSPIPGSYSDTVTIEVSY